MCARSTWRDKPSLSPPPNAALEHATATAAAGLPGRHHLVLGGQSLFGRWGGMTAFISRDEPSKAQAAGQKRDMMSRKCFPGTSLDPRPRTRFH